MNIYFISGLGADEKAFSRIKLEGVSLHHIKWVEHSKGDSFSSYAKKLIPQFDLSQPFVIIGLSFGGIMAQEISKFVHPKKIILISSVESQKHFPWFYRLGKYIIPFLPNFIFTRTNSVINYLFGAKGKNVTVLDNIMKANDPKFVKWCVNVLLRWKQRNQPDVPIVSIHGTNDKIIPYRKCNYTIENGSHFMVYTRADEIQKILQNEIDAI